MTTVEGLGRAESPEATAERVNSALRPRRANIEGLGGGGCMRGNDSFDNLRRIIILLSGYYGILVVLDVCRAGICEAGRDLSVQSSDLNLSTRKEK